MEEIIDREGKETSQQIGRNALYQWRDQIKKNIYREDSDFKHLIKFHFQKNFAELDRKLADFGEVVAVELEPLVAENNQHDHLPKLKSYDALGNRIDEVVHHPSYIEAGNIIYRSQLLEKLSKPGGTTECLTFLFLSSQTGEAGHNCPIACSAGIIRVLQNLPAIPNQEFYLQKLITHSFTDNFTGAQFLTEIQGGSDVGLNSVYAKPHDAKQTVWRIYGEKWFCSNANADLMFVTARYNPEISGTKGLALFLVPAQWQEQKNQYIIHRLKDKLGTRSMATGEIEFQGAYAYPVGSIETGFHIAMDHVLHTSRLFNSVCVLAMARRAYAIAKAYAEHRVAFGHPTIHYPLVKENLARIKAENSAMLAAIFATARMQDANDLTKGDKSKQLLLRLLVNMQKYFTAKNSVQHIHHALDTLAGNGTIETFSPIPRLLRDCIICENWEGTHNVIHAQILKDIAKYEVDKIYLNYLQSEIQQLPAHSGEVSDQVSLLTESLKYLENEFSELRRLDKEIQSLRISEIVDHMAILYCAIMLLKEAQHQVEKEMKHSKMFCYRYFYDLHFKKKISRDQQYLNLINEVMG